MADKYHSLAETNLCKKRNFYVTSEVVKLSVYKWCVSRYFD